MGRVPERAAEARQRQPHGVQGRGCYLVRFGWEERGGHMLRSSRVSKRKRSEEEKAILVLDKRGWLATALLRKPNLQATGRKPMSTEG